MLRAGDRGNYSFHADLHGEDKPETARRERGGSLEGVAGGSGCEAVGERMGKA